MEKLKKFVLGIAALAITAVTVAAPGIAQAKQVKIRVQSVIPSKADEVVMLKEFAKDVLDLTNGEVVIEVLPAGPWSGLRKPLMRSTKG